MNPQNWIDLRGLPLSFKFCAKFVQIQNQLLFYRLYLIPVALPSVAGALVSRSVVNNNNDNARNNENNNNNDDVQRSSFYLQF